MTKDSEIRRNRDKIDNLEREIHEVSRYEKFPLVYQISSFFNKIFRNEMCTWFKQLENEGNPVFGHVSR